MASRYLSPKSPAAAGTVDVAVERTEEGLAASASGNALTRAQFDAGKSAGLRRVKTAGVIYTDGQAGLTQGVDYDAL